MEIGLFPQYGGFVPAIWLGSYSIMDDYLFISELFINDEVNINEK